MADACRDSPQRLYPLKVSRNVKAVLETDFSPTQIALFGELVNQETLQRQFRLSATAHYRVDFPRQYRRFSLLPLHYGLRWFSI